MSGVIPDSIITVSTPITPNGWPAPYRIISFPTRVKVTSVSFTVDASAVGDPGVDGRSFTLAVVKGCRSRVPETPNWYEDLTPFFGDNEKPQVVCSETVFRSTIAEPPDQGLWFAAGPSYFGDVAQMDTDEYLTVWVNPDNSGLFPEEFDWSATTATISIAYTGATNLD
jgi:hypothetical protein